MTSWWARWRLESPASRLFIQPFIQGGDQRKHQSSVTLAFVRGIHRWPLNSPHKGPMTRKMLPFGDVFMRRDVSSRRSSLYKWTITKEVTWLDFLIQESSGNPLSCWNGMPTCRIKRISLHETTTTLYHNRHACITLCKCLVPNGGWPDD